ncbi:hypothetical protein [Actinomadura sp. 9N407]|uniref:hypothetical protein n=1 Tax=Actinomadura sp. 9N407 TaxID=3375154 RepID=UPI00378FCAD8
MTTICAPRPAARVETWPVTAVTWTVGAFIALVAVLVASKPLRGESFGGTDGVIVLACGLRALTIAMAQATIRPWGRRVPGWLLLGSLAGAAGLQVFYPLAELLIKLTVVVGLMEETGLGATHTDATAWFNLVMTALIWGVPGALLARIALRYRNRAGVPFRWIPLGILGGLAFLLGLGLLIG